MFWFFGKERRGGELVRWFLGAESVSLGAFLEGEEGWAWRWRKEGSTWLEAIGEEDRAGAIVRTITGDCKGDAWTDKYCTSSFRLYPRIQ